MRIGCRVLVLSILAVVATLALEGSRYAVVPVPADTVLPLQNTRRLIRAENATPSSDRTSFDWASLVTIVSIPASLVFVTLCCAKQSQRQPRPVHVSRIDDIQSHDLSSAPMGECPSVSRISERYVPSADPPLPSHTAPKLAKPLSVRVIRTGGDSGINSFRLVGASCPAAIPPPQPDVAKTNNGQSVNSAGSTLSRSPIAAAASHRHQSFPKNNIKGMHAFTKRRGSFDSLRPLT
jgi:hypothetical protein